MKILYSLLLFGLLSVSLRAAETLSYKFLNPRVETYGSDNYFTFDVMMKATAGGTYLYAAQVICNVTLANFNSTVAPALDPGFVAGTFDPPGPAAAANKYNLTANWNSGNLNIAVLANFAFNGQTPSSGAYAEVTTSWQKLCTVYCLIANSAGMAGINFQIAAMDGYQKYASGVGPLWSAYYNNPNSYIGYDFTDIYLNRIFCGNYGWTQYGGVVDWTMSVNTSVWDTTTTAALAGSASTVNAIADGLRIHPTGKLKIPEGRSLKCNGPTDIKEPIGMVLAASPAGRSQFLDNGTITYANGGTALAEQYFPHDMWHFYCIPLLQTQAWPYWRLFMKYFIEPDNVYKYVVDPDTLLQTKMKGYAVWASSTCCPHAGYAEPVGLWNTGAISIPVTRSTGNYGYNFIGNPYPSAIDLSLSGVNWGTSETMAWFWDPSAANYFVYIKAGSGTRTTSYCAGQQGFFVRHTQTDYDPTSFGVDNTIRLINSEPFLKNEESLTELLELKAESSLNTYFDKAIVRFDPATTALLDANTDALKLKGSSSAPQLFSILDDQSQLSVNVLPWSGENAVVPLGFGCGETGTYSITAGNLESFNSNVTVRLEDRQIGIYRNLRTDPVYSFSADKGENTDRFFLHFYNPSFGIGDLSGSEYQIYSSGKVLHVRMDHSTITTGAEVFMFDILGNRVFHDQLQRIPLNSFNLDLVRGYYLVKVVNGNAIHSKKVLF